MTTPIEPGLIVLHGNRLELLRDAVFDWLGRQPLAPLEEEHFLVQSNGAAEWLKMSLAEATGICAATRVELPGRFLWRAYRQVLGRDRVLAQSALERDALTWRVMRLLPTLLDRASFAPIASFLARGDPDRRLQLARHLADLYDQYQVYRADWLAAWERGRPVLPAFLANEVPLAADQRWQMELWRAIVDELSPDDRASTRTHVHRAFIDALSADTSAADLLPRRVVLFGAAHIPAQTLEALAALASRVQVLVAVPNPCRYHWADIIDGREALRALRHRHPARDDADLSTTPLEAMHLHAHPLLAAWGRQGRDFMRQLDAYDDVAESQRRFALPRVDLFVDGPGSTLLEQVQANIRDLVPLTEHRHESIDAADRSIVFHVAHGVQREVEILHDQLLALFAERGGSPIEPRNVVVMVPDIETFAPAVRAVFGQHDRNDARRIPFDIADLRSRGSNPLAVALEWLLRIPDQRVRLQEVRDLLDVPAVAGRFALDADAIPGLFAWLAGAGVRWGLHAPHRAQLGLAAAGAQNSWLFGLRRMLLGYAAGAAEPFAGIEPYDEIGGLDASSVGALAELFGRLEQWWAIARSDATPAEWAVRARTLIAAFFAPVDERERLTIAALQAALAAWLESCDAARFVEPVPLSVLREAWLSGVDGLDANRRFLAGGVTFCTLLPLRAVPFDVVCLLGMNDGDFPRRGQRADFDLMGLPGQQRPGDRSRRDDDRYLMLEALLSARRTLYVSWCGRSARDNSVQAPSVLVSQLRDYLRAGWGGDDAVDQRTTEHPLQPFSRRYFERDGLVTYAREWRVAHTVDASTADARALPPFTPPSTPLAITTLERFLKNPVRAFFQARLGVYPARETEALAEDEPFGTDRLDLHRLRSELLDDATRDPGRASFADRLHRVERAGRLPIGGLGALAAEQLTSTLAPMLARWTESLRAYPQALPPVMLRVEASGVTIEDRLDGLRSDGTRCVWLMTTPSFLVGDGNAAQAHKLLFAWIRMLLASTAGHAVDGILFGPDAMLTLGSLPADEARATLVDLLAAWREGMDAPLRFACKTAFAHVQGRSAREAYEGGQQLRPEGDEFGLHRIYPDFDALQAHDRFALYATRLFAPIDRWIAHHVVAHPCVAEEPA
jgi:exodeoxyribonuclease V gamma subunit